MRQDEQKRLTKTERQNDKTTKIRKTRGKFPQHLRGTIKDQLGQKDEKPQMTRKTSDVL